MHDHPSTFHFGGSAVRVVIQDGEPWWVAKDVCEALGFAGAPAPYVCRLDEDERGVAKLDTLGGPQNFITISESGLYRLILRSHKPEAKAFTRWVTHDVLPAIRRTGAYATENPLGFRALLRYGLTAALIGRLIFLYGAQGTREILHRLAPSLFPDPRWAPASDPSVLA